MAKSKERESFESSQLERCANLVSFMTPEFAIHFSFRAIKMRVMFNIECLINLFKLQKIFQRTIFISPHYCCMFVVLFSHSLSFTSQSTKMAKNNKNKTSDNNNNKDKNDDNKRTNTMTNDEDNKKREARKKRFAAPSILDADADVNLGGLFREEEEANHATPSSSNSNAAPTASPREEEEPMEEENDDEFGIGALFDRNAPINDAILNSDDDDDDDDARADELSRDQPRPSRAEASSNRPSRPTLRCYVEPEAEEVEKGARYDWTPSKTAYGDTPLTRRDIGCQASIGSESLNRRRELIRRHRSKKRARLEARIESRIRSSESRPDPSPSQDRDASSSRRQEAKRKEGGREIVTPPLPKRPRHPPKPQEDLRARLQNRQHKVTQPQKRARIEPPQPSDADKKAQIARRQYKARKDEQPSRRQRKKQKKAEAARQQARERSPQPSTSSGLSLPAGIEGYMARMREELLQHLEANAGELRVREDRRRRSPSPFGNSGPKDKGKGKGKGKRD